MRFDIKNKALPLLILSIAFNLSFTELCAQQDHLKINLDRIKNSKLKVTYFPSENAPSLPIKFRRYSRLCYFPLLRHSFISRPKAYDSENKKIRVKFEGNRYTPIGAVSFWEYEIDLNRYPPYINQPLQTNIKRRRKAYLYPSMFYPSPDGSELNHKISIRDNISSDSAIITGHEFTEYLDIDEFVYAGSDKDIIHKDSISEFKINLIGSFDNIQYSELEAITANLVKAFQNSTGIILPKGFEFIYAETDSRKLEKSVLPGSAVFKNNITVLIDKSKDEFEQKENLIRNVMWQLFRWISPTHTHDKSWENLNADKGNHSIHLWYYESVTEYLSLISLIENKLISEAYFTEIIQNKVSESIREPSYSLIQLGTDFSTQSGMIHIKKNLDVYDVLTNRGVVAALLMDILILNESNGYNNLLKKFLRIHKSFEDSSFPTDSFIGIFAQGHSKEFKTVIEKYVIGIDQFHFKSYFELIDWQFFRKGEEHRSFMKRGHLTYFPEIEKYVCTKAGKNSIGLQKGDIVLSINNDTQISTMDLNEIILPSKGFRNENRVKLEILRDGKEMVLRGKAEYKAKVKNDIIIPLFNPNSDGYQLRKAMLY